ncbi:hypothetical protein RIF29_07601 [Crotalaria pallida]|uniref:Uncharacterized protein n=1 Tax=Crotalaria pallida TaxID=3830 RepID=A0AAN9J4I2_CROPI
MVGVIPGVECARRRRFHDSKRSYDSSSRRSFSLYTPRNMESLLSSSPSSSSSSSLLARGILNEAYSCDNTNKLGEAAKEAKQRLDDKFNAYRTLQDNQKQKQKTKTIFNGFCLLQL